MKILVVASPLGQFRILFNEESAPETCAYFTDLVRNGALGDAMVFRVLSESNQGAYELSKINVVQIGTALCMDAPRTQVVHETTQNTGLSHQRWSVSAARFGPGELYGSFFVCMRDEPALDFGGSRQKDGQGFAAFGRVVSGFETLEKLHALAEDGDLLTQRIPIDAITLSSATQPDLDRWLIEGHRKRR